MLAFLVTSYFWIVKAWKCVSSLLSHQGFIHVILIYFLQCEILSKLKVYPEYFVQILDAIEMPNKTGIIITNLLGESLEDFISSREEGLGIDDTRIILRKLLKGLKFLEVSYYQPNFSGILFNIVLFSRL